MIKNSLRRARQSGFAQSGFAQSVFSQSGFAMGLILAALVLLSVATTLFMGSYLKQANSSAMVRMRLASTNLLNDAAMTLAGEGYLRPGVFSKTNDAPPLPSGMGFADKTKGAPIYVLSAAPKRDAYGRAFRYCAWADGNLVKSTGENAWYNPPLTWAANNTQAVSCFPGPCPPTPSPEATQGPDYNSEDMYVLGAGFLIVGRPADASGENTSKILFDNASAPAFALISDGPDGVPQTMCPDIADSYDGSAFQPKGDDMVRVMTAAELRTVLEKSSQNAANVQKPESVPDCSALPIPSDSIGHALATENGQLTCKPIPMGVKLPSPACSAGQILVQGPPVTETVNGVQVQKAFSLVCATPPACDPGGTPPKVLRATNNPSQPFECVPLVNQAACTPDEIMLADGSCKKCGTNEVKDPASNSCKCAAGLGYFNMPSTQALIANPDPTAPKQCVNCSAQNTTPAVLLNSETGWCQPCAGGQSGVVFAGGQCRNPPAVREYTPPFGGGYINSNYAVTWNPQIANATGVVPAQGNWTFTLNSRAETKNNTTCRVVDADPIWFTNFNGSSSPQVKVGWCGINANPNNTCTAAQVVANHQATNGFIYNMTPSANTLICTHPAYYGGTYPAVIQQYVNMFKSGPLTIENKANPW